MMNSNEINKDSSQDINNPLVQTIGLDQILAYTGTSECCIEIAKTPILSDVVQWLQTVKSDEALKRICKILVNLSATEEVALKILDTPSGTNRSTVQKLIEIITQAENSTADAAAMILSNLTHTEEMVKKVIPNFEPLSKTIDKLLNAFSATSKRNENYTLDYIAMILCNISRETSVRRCLTDKQDKIMERLIPFINFESGVRKRGVLGTIKNCCFDYEIHPWLLEDLELLPRLLLPLAGGEEFDDEDTKQLPIDLQYLDDDKEREPDWEIRKEILEILNQLCTTRDTRKYLRDNGTYLILREYHKWEKDRQCLLAIENVVDILIRTESEIGRDNIVQGVEVPDDMVEKFNVMDSEFLET